MSESTGNPQLDLWDQRNATFMGKVVNTVVDWGRMVAGKPSLLQETAEQTLQKIESHQAFMEHAQTAIDGSDLDQADQKLAMTMLSNLPDLDRQDRDMMIERTIDYVREQAENRLLQNQQNLFTDAMLRNAQPFDRSEGLSRLEDLAVALYEAEEGMYDNLTVDNVYGPWDHVDDQAERVMANRSATTIAKEWGLQVAGPGVLLNARGTALTSGDLLEKISQERSLTLTSQYDRGVGR